MRRPTTRHDGEKAESQKSGRDASRNIEINRKVRKEILSYFSLLATDVKNNTVALHGACTRHGWSRRPRDIKIIGWRAVQTRLSRSIEKKGFGRVPHDFVVHGKTKLDLGMNTAIEDVRIFAMHPAIRFYSFGRSLSSAVLATMTCRIDIRQTPRDAPMVAAPCVVGFPIQEGESARGVGVLASHSRVFKT